MQIRLTAQMAPAKRFIRSAWLATGISLLAAASLHAADNWDFEPSIKQSASWDSNPLLLSGGHKTLYGSVTEPQLLITDKTPTTQLSAQATVDENIFNLSGFDSTDLHTNINLDKKLERWEAGFIDQMDYDTTRTSEITTFNTNSLGSIRHFGNSFSPDISFSPSPVDKITLAASYQNSRYDSNLFTDYHTLSVTPSYQYNVTPLNTATLSVQAQRYQTDVSPDSTIDSIAPTLGWTAVLTPTWTAKASAGVEDYREQVPGIPTQQWQWKPIFSADLSYKNEKDVFSIDALRALQPYANGTEFFLNTLSLNDTHSINTLFSTNVSLSYQFAGNNNQAADNLKTLVTANTGLTYHPTQRIDITASYQYREQTLTNITGDQNDSLVMLSLVWRPVLSILNSKN
jgi:hypothetical protein